MIGVWLVTTAGAECPVFVAATWRQAFSVCHVQSFGIRVRVGASGGAHVFLVQPSAR